MTAPRPFSIKPIRTQADLQDTIRLFYEYATWLGFDLTFQNFDEEMAAMPGKYSPPTGELLLARDQQGKAIGCVALRPLASEALCEMKRLYVPEAGRGIGVGRALALSIIDIAEDLGYSEMRLDTLPEMKVAVRLYETFDFVPIEAYYATPLEGTIFLSLKLPRQKSSTSITRSLD